MENWIIVALIVAAAVAHVPQKRETAQYNTFTRGSLGSCQVGTTAAYQWYLTTGWAETVITANGATLSGANITSTIGPTPYSCSTNPNAFISNSGASAHYSSLILDVTNY